MEILTGLADVPSSLQLLSTDAGHRLKTMSAATWRPKDKTVNGRRSNLSGKHRIDGELNVLGTGSEDDFT